MLALDFIRRHPEAVQRAADLKRDHAPVDEILALDRRWRERLAEAESLRAEQNQRSKEFGRTKDQALLAGMRALAERVRGLNGEADDLKRELDELLLEVPNLFDESVPVGATEADNVVIRQWGEKPRFDFPPRTHFDLAESLDILDFERAAKVAGARFAFLKEAGSRLERALTQFMLDVHVDEHGYREVLPPFLVNSAAMVGTAQLPKFAGDAWRVADSDLWLVPTAEVPVTNLHRDEILEAAQLPLRYVGFSPCWRSEAGAAGKDTRGYIRMHQFDKVELVKLARPEDSMREFEALTADAEAILQRLELHYQVKLMCTADMGFAQYKKYDLEVWCPGLERYLEVSSCSVFADFQARRANLRYREAAGEPPRFLHTMNGSGLALPRTWDAVVETYQRRDGAIAVPAALRRYMGGLEAIEPA